ncbi:glycosyl hydrolase family 20 [Colletotrichum truncatum]|uniref:Glycosyl hydrolase family 20 n=1 Tax=Colletotrichum truncatum TaxID=5467 RepID=A0ACC3YUQ6_COLTU|nr:glycosyl hydrolase family 20 [Colletotrichum truncatum]KAF6785835.1 glycosyl hydrolase family 20 [Colletotrichum truncatum]
MCAYLSFFKQNEFHLHLSDNLFVNKALYTTEQIWALYSSFRLRSDERAVAGLNQLQNESYSYEQFQDIQKQCAERGVTVIPEIEAPAHALVITKWKPEIALNQDPTMLNISHPSTVPTLKTIWSTFLPWFRSKTVHIGADEYQASLIRDYTYLVNELSMFIQELSGKATRIWGTFTPAKGANVSKDVVIQHWAPYEDNAYFDFIQNGYDVVNSDFAFYTNVKWNGYFPPTLPKTLIFEGNPMGGSFAPHIFDVKNATNNPDRSNPRVVGHIAAQWNDFGPATSTYLEAYHGWRDGLPALADKQWGGSLKEYEYDAIIETLIAAAPGQNLDRRIKSESSVILDYHFPKQNTCSRKIKDQSGNGYDGISHGCQIHNSTLHLDGRCYVETPLDSKGRNYTLSFSVHPLSSEPGVLFSGPDSALVAGNGSSTNLTFIAAGIAFPLNYTLPLHTWTDVVISGIGGSTFLTASSQTGNQTRNMEFLTRIEANGVPSANGVMVIWKPMAIEAPLREIGRGFIGMIRNVTLASLESK